MDQETLSDDFIFFLLLIPQKQEYNTAKLSSDFYLLKKREHFLLRNASTTLVFISK